MDLVDFIPSHVFYVFKNTAWARNRKKTLLKIRKKNTLSGKINQDQESQCQADALLRQSRVQKLSYIHKTYCFVIVKASTKSNHHNYKKQTDRILRDLYFMFRKAIGIILGKKFLFTRCDNEVIAGLKLENIAVINN